MKHNLYITYEQQRDMMHVEVLVVPFNTFEHIIDLINASLIRKREKKIH